MNAKHKKAPGVERNAGEERAGGNAHGAHTTTTPGGVKLQKGNPTMDKKANTAPVVRFVGHTPAEQRAHLADLQFLKQAISGIMKFGETTMIVSPPGLGKTNLGYQMAICLSTGHDVLRCHVCKAHGVYIDQEMTEYDEVVRQNAIAKGLHLNPDIQDFINVVGDEQPAEFPITLDNLEECIKYLFEKYRWELKHAFVVIDTLAETAAFDDENVSSEVLAKLKQIRKFARKYQLAIVLFHHTKKNDRDFRGSSQFRGSVDNLFLQLPSNDEEEKQWQKRCDKLGIPGKVKGFVIFKPVKVRRGLARTLHLESRLLPRDDSIPHDPDDDSKTDGFLWFSLGELGNEDESEVARFICTTRGDDYALGWDSEIGGYAWLASAGQGASDDGSRRVETPKREPARQRWAREVVARFGDSDAKFPNKAALSSAVVNATHCAKSSGDNAVNYALQLKVIQYSKRGDVTSALELAPAGLKLLKLATGADASA